jgi:hypothetical protein
MKTLFAIVIGSSLALAATAQLQPPPPITSAPPPLNPNVAPAAPQPGLPTGASGASAFGTTSGTVTGRPAVSTPFPVVVPSGAFPPEVFDPLELVNLGQMLQAAPSPQPSPSGGIARGRPGGLGVTITGGGSDQPAGPGVTITGGSADQPGVATPALPASAPVTNAVPSTNVIVPANPGGASVTNAVPQYR